MNSKLPTLFLFFLVLWTTDRYSVAGYVRHISKPSKYVWNEKIRSIIPDETPVRQYTDCGGRITKAPGTIEQLFVSRNPSRDVHCVWTIRAPANHHVYVKQLRITRTTLQSDAGGSGKFDDAPIVQIFDGTEATEANRLFRFGDATLNRCLSSGQELTIDLHYNELGKHIDQEAFIKYGFIESSKASDLLP